MQLKDNQTRKISPLLITSWIFSSFLESLCASSCYKSFKAFSLDLISMRVLIIPNKISMGIFYLFYFEPFFNSLKFKTFNSLLVIKNVDTELLGSFRIFYIIMAVLYSYELYQFTDTLLTITIWEIKYYIFLLCCLYGY